MSRFLILVLFAALFIPELLAASDAGSAGTVAGVVSTDTVNTGTMTGRIMLKQGGPMAEGTVFLFNRASGPPPLHGKYARVPDEIADTDSEGRFTVQLPEGAYYIGAIKRKSKDKYGPPQEGDIFLTEHTADAVQKNYSVSAGKITDIGIIARAVPYDSKIHKVAGSTTIIEGVITDQTGQPVEGALVFASLTPKMTEIPLFVSEKTGKNGSYVLRVHEGGTYYIRVRDVYGGGAPKSVGAFMGAYGNNQQSLPLTVKTGETLKGVDIQGQRFTGRGGGNKKKLVP